MTLAQTEKKFMIIKRLILQSCSWMYYLLDSSTCSHFTKDFFWEFSSSFGDRTEAFSLLLSSSACLYPLLQSPLSLPLPSRTVHIYSYSCSCSWIYIYAIVRPKLSSMYRDHRFLYVEPSSVYLHLYGTIYIQYLCLYDVYLEYCFTVIYLTIHMHVKNFGLLHFHYIYDIKCY